MRFADTGYFLGLLGPRDQLHRQVLAISQLRETKLLTTTWVLVEVANAMSALPERAVFVEFARNFIQVGKGKIVPANEDWFTKGFDFYRRWSDKARSLTDGISFLVMQEYGITEALTADHHFAQTGFRVLLQN